MKYSTPLVDLEELCLKCRDQKARSYIEEAVNCYKAGAFRASIVSTYTAILYDLIDKFRDLALSGDQEAKKQYDAFERASQSGDFAASMKFERDVLDVAHSKLQLVSNNELLDLLRIKEDRNRCAHPTITMDGNVFHPSGALARNHIRVAVESLLQHRPAQGKAAIKSIIQTLDSEFFPSGEKDVNQTLKKTALANGRDSLIRNFTVVCLKAMLKSNMDYRNYINYAKALLFVFDNHHEIYTATITSKLNVIIRDLPDGELSRATKFLIVTKTTHEFLEDDVVAKIKTYIARADASKINLEGSLKIPILADTVKARIKRLSLDEIKDMWLFSSDEVLDRVLTFYGGAGSFDEANSIGKVLIESFWDFDTGRAKKVIEIAKNNTQISGSHEFARLMEKFRESKEVDNTVLDEV